MALFIVRRISDNLVTHLQSANTPDAAAMQANAVASTGGIPTDYEVAEVSDVTAAAIRANYAANSYSFFDDVDVTAGIAPSLSVVAGVGQVTVSCDCNDVAYSGAIAWECTSPDGVTASTSGAAVNGLDDWIIVTGQIGAYSVRVIVPGRGFASIEFEEA